MSFRNRVILLMPTLALTVSPQLVFGDDVENAQRVCAVYEGMGANMTCRVSAAESAVDLTIDAPAAEAAAACAGLGSSMVHLAQMFSGKWQLRIFTPASADKAVATCDLG